MDRGNIPVKESRQAYRPERITTQAYARDCGLACLNMIGAKKTGIKYEEKELVDMARERSFLNKEGYLEVPSAVAAANYFFGLKNVVVFTKTPHEIQERLQNREVPDKRERERLKQLLKDYFALSPGNPYYDYDNNLDPKIEFLKEDLFGNKEMVKKIFEYSKYPFMFISDSHYEVGLKITQQLSGITVETIEPVTGKKALNTKPYNINDMLFFPKHDPNFKKRKNHLKEAGITVF